MSQLRDALATQPVIEQATGMVMLLCGWPPEAAFGVLRSISQRTSVKLHEVAAIVVAAGSRTGAAKVDGGTASAVLAELRRQFPGVAFDADSDPG
ncbi:ANTAR domain-containing protein [Amycolatopsis sp. lyj-23]|uniref:ANTAR domain-containing protein n=1 Tax=Amycolatopsis sp. lyj-23 TaxID=2789283 RepID=UPI00397902CF